MLPVEWQSPNHRALEDKLLLKYWEAVGGLMYAEVVIGGRGLAKEYPEGSRIRRIDGVRIDLRDHGPASMTLFAGANASGFKDTVSNAVKVEVIEVKRKLNRLVIGQVIVGADLLEMEYGRRDICQVIVCGTGDPLLEMVCERRNIAVKKIKL